MTTPNNTAPYPAPLFGVTGQAQSADAVGDSGTPADLVGRTQEAIEAILKNQLIQLSPNWSATTAAVWGDLRRGQPGQAVPLLVSAFEAFLQNTFGITTTWPTLTELMGDAGTFFTTKWTSLTDIDTDVQDFRNAIANALGHTGGEPYSNSDILTFLEEIPGSVISGALNTAVTISGNALSTLFNTSGLIASEITGALNTAVTISGNALSTLFNSSGLIASQIAGALNTAVTISGNAINSLFNGSGIIATAIGAVLGGSSLGADLKAVATTLFGSSTTASQVQQSSLPSLIGNSNLGQDIQNGWDAIVNALTGGSGSGNTPTAVASTMTAIPHTNVVIPPNAGSGAIALDATSHGTAATQGNMSAWSHTVGTSGNYLIVNVAALTGNPSSVVAVTYGGVPMSLLKSVTSGSLVYSLSQVWGLANPVVGAANISVTVTVPGTVPIIVAASAQSYTNVATVGAANAAFGSNGSPSNSIPSATGDFVVNTLFVASATTEILSSYNQTSRYNPGSTHDASTGWYMAILAGDASGGATVNFSATASFTTSNEWAWVAVNLIPIPATKLGSSFRAYRSSASSVTMISGSGDSLLPNSFFDTTSSGTLAFMTSDLAYAPGTANKLTVSYEGTYAVNISLDYTGWNSGSFYSCPILYKNGGVVERGHYDSGGAATGSFAGPKKASFLVYCVAGDTLQPGIMSNGSFSGVGESTGTYCYWAVALANRGVFS